MPAALVNRGAVVRLNEVQGILRECPSEGPAFRAILENEQADGMALAVRKPGFWEAFTEGRLKSEEINGGGPNRGMRLRW